MGFNEKWGVWDEPWAPMFNKLEVMCRDLDYYIYDLYYDIGKFGFVTLLPTKKANEIQKVLQGMQHLELEIKWQKENNSSIVKILGLRKPTMPNDRKTRWK